MYIWGKAVELRVLMISKHSNVNHYYPFFKKETLMNTDPAKVKIGRKPQLKIKLIVKLFTIKPTIY